jgi:hypothetical protein
VASWELQVRRNKEESSTANNGHSWQCTMKTNCIMQAKWIAGTDCRTLTTMKMNITNLLSSSYATCCQSSSLSNYRVECYRLILHRYLSHVCVMCWRSIVNYMECMYLAIPEASCVAFLYFTCKQLQKFSLLVCTFRVKRGQNSFRLGSHGCL